MRHRRTSLSELIFPLLEKTEVYRIRPTFSSQFLIVMFFDGFSLRHRCSIKENTEKLDAKVRHFVCSNITLLLTFFVEIILFMNSIAY